MYHEAIKKISNLFYLSTGPKTIEQQLIDMALEQELRHDMTMIEDNQ